MKIGDKEVKEIQITTDAGEPIASITDDNVIGKHGYKVECVASAAQPPQKPIICLKDGRIIICCDNFAMSPDEEIQAMKKQIHDLQEKVMQLYESAILGKIPKF